MAISIECSVFSVSIRIIPSAITFFIAEERLSLLTCFSRESLTLSMEKLSNNQNFGRPCYHVYCYIAIKLLCGGHICISRAYYFFNFLCGSVSYSPPSLYISDAPALCMEKRSSIFPFLQILLYLLLWIAVETKGAVPPGI